MTEQEESEMYAKIPEMVRAAEERAEKTSFEQSCEPAVGALLGALAAAVPRGGRILELGTGTGVGTAWLASGVGPRTHVTLTTVEVVPELADSVRAAGLPDWVDVVTGDALDVVPRLGRFDLIFADAVAGKWEGLEVTLRALAPGGILVVDDMQPARYDRPEHRAVVDRIRATLTSDPELATADFVEATGLMLATRRAA